jgi:alpha-1,3-rhamnosyl/mannosyltransferase
MKNENIALDCRYIHDHFPGIGRYVYNLAVGLGELASSENFTLNLIYNPHLPNKRYNLSALAEAQPGAVRLIPTEAQPFSLPEHWQLPRLALKHKFDLWHAPYYIRPYMMPCPVILTAYDLTGKKIKGVLPGMKAKVAFEITTRLAFLTARRILTLSNSAKMDICELYRVKPEKIKVVPPGVENKFSPAEPEAVKEMRKKLKLPASYILYVGINKPHKNLGRLLEAFRLYREGHSDSPVKLLVAGRTDPRYSPELENTVERLKLRDLVEFRGEVSEEELVWLYRGAILYVQPSLYEGFGLPVLEAQACGTPVICARTSSLPEAAGSAVSLFDPHSVPDIAEKLEAMLVDENRQRENIRLGLAHSRNFTWEKAAKATLELYREALR